MVWFQCEACGDQLKKPKLPNHFRICSAYKFSCIDCGEAFDQASVQGHTQCITEAEKYGPKGQAKAANGSAPKQNKDPKQKLDFDVNVGLSDRPPWFCSLCNTKATSKQNLLLHADGKKHRAKAKAFHANQQPKPTDECVPDTKTHTDDSQKNKLLNNKDTEGMEKQDPREGDAGHIDTTQNGDALSKKKRKLRASENSQVAGEGGNGEVIQSERAEAGDREKKVKKAKSKEDKDGKVVESNLPEEDTRKEIKWKKLITSALKSNPDGALRKKKLRKLVLKALQESGITKDENELNDILEHKITSSSRFSVDKKYVRLVSRAE